jgi:hypothetical protein
MPPARMFGGRLTTDTFLGEDGKNRTSQDLQKQVFSFPTDLFSRVQAGLAVGIARNWSKRNKFRLVKPERLLKYTPFASLRAAWDGARKPLILSR